MTECDLYSLPLVQRCGVWVYNGRLHDSQIYDEFSDDRYDTLLTFVDRLSAAYPELRMDPQLIMDALDETRMFFGGTHSPPCTVGVSPL